MSLKDLGIYATAVTVTNVVHRIIGPGADFFGPYSHLRDDLGMDSLKATELHIALEEAFNISIPDAVADGWTRVCDITVWVADQIRNPVPIRPEPVEMKYSGPMPKPPETGKNVALPRYRSHKIVEAAPIIGYDPTGLTITVLGAGYIVVPRSFFARGEPKAGDYLVRYEDGYLSFSPKKAFEDGYTALADVPPEPYPELLAAAKKVLRELEARIDAAPSVAKPVFNGIVDLHDAIHHVEAFGAAKLAAPSSPALRELTSAVRRVLEDGITFSSLTRLDAALRAMPADPIFAGGLSGALDEGGGP